MTAVFVEGRPRILVIDPDDDLCDMLRRKLTETGFAVATVPDHASALELVKHHRPAIVLMDVELPIMDAWSFLGRYRRQETPPAAVILLSDLDDVERNLALFGAAGFVRKPIDFDHVLRAIGSCLAAT